MATIVPLSYSVRSLLRRRRSTVAAMGGIALVVLIVSSSLMLGAGIREALSSAAEADAVIVLRKGSDSEFGSVIERTSASEVIGSAGIQSDESGSPVASAELVAVAALEKQGARPGDVANIQVRGVPARAFTLRPRIRVVEGTAIQPGSEQAIIGARLRGRFPGLELGESFELRKGRPLRVVGVFEADGASYESEIWADIDTVAAAFGREGTVSSVRARLVSPDQFDAFAADLEGDQRLGLEVMRESSFLQSQASGISTLVTALGTVITLFFSIGATLGATITMYAAVEQRKPEVAILRALGFSRGSVLIAFTLEALILAVSGGVIGALGSLALSRFELSMVNFATWSEIVIAFTPTAETVGTAMIIAVVMGLAGGLLPALRAAGSVAVPRVAR